jgi:hypothetical protein
MIKTIALALTLTASATAANAVEMPKLLTQHSTTRWVRGRSWIQGRLDGGPPKE